jgi:hypothetical protein
MGPSLIYYRNSVPSKGCAWGGGRRRSARSMNKKIAEGMMSAK